MKGICELPCQKKTMDGTKGKIVVMHCILNFRNFWLRINQNDRSTTHTHQLTMNPIFRLYISSFRKRETVSITSTNNLANSEKKIIITII